MISSAHWQIDSKAHWNSVKQTFVMKKETHIIFGVHAVIEALRSGKEFERIFLKKDLSGDPLREILKSVRDQNIPYQFVPNEKLDQLTRKNHQGVIGLVSAIEYQKIEQIIPILFEQGKTPLILILDHITDVRNFGSIVRSAECAGVDAIVIPDKGAAQVNADAIKTSSGALNFMPVCRESNLIKTIQFLANSGLKIYAASEKGNSVYYEADFTCPLAIVAGSEHTGVSVEVLRKSDEVLRIPIHGKITSLNVTVAAALMVFEAAKQRKLQ